MWLKLNLDGIVVNLRIRQYKKPDNNNWDCTWCKVDFSFCSNPWLDYKKENCEVLLAQEVDDLIEALENLLSDKLSEPTEFSFVEPDFVFNLSPKEDLRNNPRILYVRPGCEFSDIYMEWQVHFWDEGYLAANFLTVTLGQEEIEYLLTYLKTVTGELSEQDLKVQELIVKGVIY